MVSNRDHSTWLRLTRDNLPGQHPTGRWDTLGHMRWSGWGLGILLVVIAVVGYEERFERKRLKDSIEEAEAAMEQAQKTVKDLEEKVEELESEVDDLNSRVEDVEDQDGDYGPRHASQRVKRTRAPTGTSAFDPNAYLSSPATHTVPGKAGGTSGPVGFIPDLPLRRQNQSGPIKVTSEDVRARADKKLVESVVVDRPSPPRNALSDKKLVEFVLGNKGPPPPSKPVVVPRETAP